MNFLPDASSIEVPVLLELAATGGTEDVKFLYARLLPYFPRVAATVRGDAKHLQAWRKSVQRAGKQLEELNHIARVNGRWRITEQGRTRAAAEQLDYTPALPSSGVRAGELAHRDAQQMLLEVGAALGFHAVAEEDFIDVVWRVRHNSPRRSHVFEVQRRGNLDSALAKLKSAFELHRSKVYLVVATERDTRRARQAIDASASGAFHELAAHIEIISFEQLARVHQAVIAVRDLLPSLLER